MLNISKVRTSGDNLLNIFSKFEVQLRNLSPNVVRAWFDTECPDTQNLLCWMAESLTDSNYLSSLDRHEFEKIENPLDSQKCHEELVRLNPDYVEIFNPWKNCEAISLLENEILILQQEEKDLDELMELYESVGSKISSNLTYNTKKEIQSQVECKSTQSDCEKLCRELDQVNMKLREKLIKYDPDSHFVNVIDIKAYNENIKYISGDLAPLVKLDKTVLEKCDDNLSADLEICKKRILHSHQLYLVNQVESEKLRQLLEHLSMLTVAEIQAGFRSGNLSDIDHNKAAVRSKLCETLNEVATKATDHHLKQTKIQYVKRELESYRKKLQIANRILDTLTKLASLYAITNCLQLQEKKDVVCIANFYEKMFNYVEYDLSSCRSRTEKMKQIIEEHNSYSVEKNFEQSKLFSTIASVLGLEGASLKSVAEAVGQLKAELSMMESQLLCLTHEEGSIQQLSENIKILEGFLTSGPTERIVLVPDKLWRVYLLMEEHFKKESASVELAVQTPQRVMKSLTSLETYARQLWMSFLANPAKVEVILKQAEDVFNQKNSQYF